MLFSGARRKLELHFSDAVARIRYRRFPMSDMGLKRGYGTTSGLIFALLLTAIVSGCGGGGSSTSSSPAAAVSLSSVAVTPKSATFTAGVSQQLDATATYSDGSTKDVATTATWSSSNPSVATVSASGLALGVGAGTATISATLSGVSGSASVTVKVLTSIQLSPSGASFAIGISQQFIAAGTYNDGSIQDLSSTVTWSSSNPSIATASSSGVVTTLAPGTVSITASIGTAQGTASLIVPQSSGGLVLNTNLTDSLVLSGTGSDGTTVQFFGNRDATGLPLGLSAVSATQPDGSVQTALLDSQGRITKVSDSAGVDFEIDWTSATGGVATAYPYDGSTPVSAPFDMSSAQSSNSSPVDPSFAGKRAEGKQRARTNPTQPKAKITRDDTSQSSTQLTVSVYDSCTTPNPIDNATVQVVFTHVSGIVSRPYPLQSIGNGSYSAEFATSNLSTADGASMAQAAQGLVNGLCQPTTQFANYICSQIDLALDANASVLKKTLIEAECNLVNPATKVCNALSSAVNSWANNYDPTLLQYTVTAELPPAPATAQFTDTLSNPNPQKNLQIPYCFNPTLLQIEPLSETIGVGQIQSIRVDMLGGPFGDQVIRPSGYPIQWSTSDVTGTYVLAANQNVTSGTIASTGPNLSVEGVSPTEGSGVAIYATVPTLPNLGTVISTLTVQGCSAQGTWSGGYTGEDGSSGTVSASFTQNGSDIAGLVTVTDASGTASSTVTGTDSAGSLQFGPVTVEGTSDSATGSFIDIDCQTVSGLFSVVGTQTVLGSYTVTKQ